MSRRSLLAATGMVAAGALTARATQAAAPRPIGYGAPTTAESLPAGTGSTERAVSVPRPNANPYLAGNFAPVSDELTVTDLKVIGKIPAALNGSFMRNGPNPHQVNNAERTSWFPGNGMIHALKLGDGQAISYRNRYVRTKEMSAALGGPPVPGPDVVGFDESNTNVAPFGGRILSVCEGAMPYVITDGAETVERIDFGGGLTHGLSAHCKFDPLTGELHNVSYRVGPAPAAVWQVIAADGRVTRTVPIELDIPGMWHTFSLTDTYVIVYDHPVVFDAQRAGEGWFPFAWHPERPRRIGLIARAGDGTIRWIEAPTLNSMNHDIAAHDTPSGVTVHFSSSSRQFDHDKLGPLEAAPTLERLDIDVNANTATTTTVSDLAQEFPRANPHLGLGPARYVYTVGHGPGVAGGGVLEVGNHIIKHDLRDGRTEMAAMGPARSTAEAVFIVDPDRSEAEDGGWLVSYVYDGSTDRTDFVITDAQNLAGPPVARIELPARVPYGFHGNWIASA